MPPVTIGRIGFRVIPPPNSQELSVFMDAGGRQSSYRIWGGLAAFGLRELHWIKELLADLRRRDDIRLESSGELKGKSVPLAVAKAVGRRIRDEDRHIVFWGSRYPPLSDRTFSEARDELRDFLVSLRSAPDRLDRSRVNEWSGDMATYYRRLGPVNKHKLVSIITHFQWLVSSIRKTGLGGRLASAKIVIDREDFPGPEACAILTKAFVCSGLQSAGMSYRLTGRAPRESPDEGAVSVEVHADSATNPGLELVDILLQVVQARLQPKYTRSVK